MDRAVTIVLTAEEIRRAARDSKTRLGLLRAVRDLAQCEVEKLVREQQQRLKEAGLL